MKNPPSEEERMLIVSVPSLDRHASKVSTSTRVGYTNVPTAARRLTGHGKKPSKLKEIDCPIGRPSLGAVFFFHGMRGLWVHARYELKLASATSVAGLSTGKPRGK